jgi:hypothetical protein
MVPAVNVEMICRFLDAQLLKEDIRHVVVEMLAGMDDDFLELVRGSYGSGYNAGFDELRASAEDGKDFYDFALPSAMMFA